jgi:hypothetical protein
MDIYEEINGIRTDVQSLKTILLELIEAVGIIGATTHSYCEVHGKKFLNGKEAAKYLEVSESSFRRHKEKIPFIKKGKRLVYKVEDLDSYVKQRTVNTDKEIDFMKVSKNRAYAIA